MSYILEKPYTDIEKADFVVKYNHNQGLKIVESDYEIIALLDNEMIEEYEVEVETEFQIEKQIHIKTVINPNYDEEQKEKERQRINSLKVTKRVFALALQQFGITYTQLKELIATNEQAQLEWDLCVELERSNPLLDLMATQMGVTGEQLDYIFVEANKQNDNLV